jgi:hypothetical protein
MQYIRKLFSIECRECHAVRVWFWQVRCAFCDKDEGSVK